MPVILFICTGNTCRSPLAAAMARELGADAESAGLYASPGSPASEGARRAAARRGLDLSAHRSQTVTRELVARAERVYAMTSAHQQALREMYPDMADKILALSPSISDPFGGEDDVYEQCAWDLEDALKNCLKRKDAP